MDEEILNADVPYFDEYLACIAHDENDAENRRAAWRSMAESGCLFRGAPVPFSYAPRIFGERTQHLMRQTADMAYRILCKVITRYRQDESYRGEFHFDERVKELVLLPDDYDMPLPYARLDCLCDEEAGRLVFCEFNADASSGMHESKSALDAFERSAPFREFARSHAFHDDRRLHFDGWVRKFMALREQALGRRHETVEHPHMAIVVCFDSPNPDLGEVGAYCALFEQAGLPCSVFDVREISFDGVKMRGGHALVGESDVEIDSIWRFAITVDLLTHWDDVQGFIEGVRAGAAVMVGGFATQIVHDKQVFAVLRRPSTLQMLTDEERAFVESHIPYTAFLDDPALDLDDVRAHPERWIVKPTDWYESKNVAYGGDYTPEEWGALIDERLASRAGSSPWIAQRFCKPASMPVVPLWGNDEGWTCGPAGYGVIYGLFMFAGEFSGYYLRQGPHAVIGSARGCLVVPVLSLEGGEA